MATAGSGGAHVSARLLGGVVPRDDVHRLLAADELPHAVRGEHHELVRGRQVVHRVLRIADHADLQGASGRGGFILMVGKLHGE